MGGRRWRGWEVGQMLDRFTDIGATAMVQDIGRSVDAITSEARRLGLSSPSRRRRQALSRASNNTSVNVRFFDTLTPTVAYCLGFIWATGTVRTKPRHVLKLRCPASRETDLLTVRAMLASRHRVQRRQGQVVCEISSYRLVETLVHKFGYPPSWDRPDPPLPTLPGIYVPYLARGLLVSAGFVNDAQIRWAGTARAMEELADLIRTATGISAPQKGRLGKSHGLSWDKPDEVCALSTWLRLRTPVFAEDVHEGTIASSLPSVPSTVEGNPRRENVGHRALQGARAPSTGRTMPQRLRHRTP